LRRSISLRIARFSAKLLAQILSKQPPALPEQVFGAHTLVGTEIVRDVDLGAVSREIPCKLLNRSRSLELGIAALFFAAEDFQGDGAGFNHVVDELGFEVFLDLLNDALVLLRVTDFGGGQTPDAAEIKGSLRAFRVGLAPILSKGLDALLGQIALL